MARERGHPPVAALSARPLILTAELDAGTTAHLDALRRRHFPPERNLLRAHLTLFHALPDDLEAVSAAARAAAPSAPLPATVARLIKLGHGVAYAIDAPELIALRARIAAAGFELTPQDRSWNRPHVTVQNKVTPAEASALFDELSADFEPWPATVTGLSLFHYEGGPWTPAASIPFA